MLADLYCELNHLTIPDIARQCPHVHVWHFEIQTLKSYVLPLAHCLMFLQKITKMKILVDHAQCLPASQCV